MSVIRLTAVFAGIAAVLTAAGIGRIAAQASIEQVGRGDEISLGGRRHAAWIAARTHAVAGIGLLVIAAIPQGHVPQHHAGWLAMIPIGALVGAACGAAIGIVCGGSAPINILDVLALARTPTAKLRTLLDPEDLVKIAAVVRARTTRVFHAMFDPAARPPDATSKPTHDADDDKSKRD
ncbi:MAG TPA: hypothetical protein VH143_17665 [Kofleriaceae bacterium]|nr:hypothetical protein [Kofleriaceae bacterium]